MSKKIALSLDLANHLAENRLEHENQNACLRRLLGLPAYVRPCKKRQLGVNPGRKPAPYCYPFESLKIGDKIELKRISPKGTSDPQWRDVIRFNRNKKNMYLMVQGIGSRIIVTRTK